MVKDNWQAHAARLADEKAFELQVFVAFDRLITDAEAAQATTPTAPATPSATAAAGSPPQPLASVLPDVATTTALPPPPHSTPIYQKPFKT